MPESLRGSWNFVVGCEGVGKDACVANFSQSLMASITDERWTELQGEFERLKAEIAKVVVGQNETVEHMLAALICRGHCLIVGVPGLGKTLLISTLGRALGLKFSRIQFTPDLMPSDILGTEILQGAADGARNFEFVPGPLFANLVLADEINRTPPKTQSALLEAMQERQITVAGVTRKLNPPFTVFATQNPIEHEGTYPLPEAQLDRFFFELKLGYPSFQEEEMILDRTTGSGMPDIQAVMDGEELLRIQRDVLEVPVPDHVRTAILKLTHSSRPGSDAATDHVKRYVAWGAGPRASQTLMLAAKALAMLRGRTAASVVEVRDAALPVMRHRVIPNYNATGENITADDIVTRLCKDNGLPDLAE